MRSYFALEIETIGDIDDDARQPGDTPDRETDPDRQPDITVGKASDIGRERCPDDHKNAKEPRAHQGGESGMLVAWPRGRIFFCFMCRTLLIAHRILPVVSR